MAKHSPGPWRWEGDDLLDAEGCLVTTVVDSLRPWCDAGVIAAAPEMYELLEEEPGPYGMEWHWQEWRERKRALLARIDGESAEGALCLCGHPQEWHEPNEDGSGPCECSPPDLGYCPCLDYSEREPDAGPGKSG